MIMKKNFIGEYAAPESYSVSVKACLSILQDSKGGTEELDPVDPE